jgi:pimeloyl-ACP methyl ester carboxylesterase
MVALARYWAEGFDWAAQQAILDRFHHFRADLDGLGIHFIHERGRGSRPLPLLITHGWPGSFLEMLKILPLLTDPASHGGRETDAFDVVVPSLPGYGFSDPPSVRGVGNQRTADLWAALMSRLGYERFGAQGGDWGAGVSTWLARRHPERLLGIHLNYIPGSYAPSLEATPPTAAERAFLEERQRWLDSEAAYAHVQITKPQTLGIALNDSPAGLMAWIVEKFRDWGDCGGILDRRFTRDELLANVTLYWVTQTAHSSFRFYYESARTPLRFEAGERLVPPCGVAVFPKEAPSPPREWVERVYDVRRWTVMPSGGHFAAMEEPQRLAEDIRDFFRPLRG